MLIFFCLYTDFELYLSQTFDFVCYNSMKLVSQSQAVQWLAIVAQISAINVVHWYT